MKKFSLGKMTTNFIQIKWKILEVARDRLNRWMARRSEVDGGSFIFDFEGGDRARWDPKLTISGMSRTIDVSIDICEIEHEFPFVINGYLKCGDRTFFWEKITNGHEEYEFLGCLRWEVMSIDDFLSLTGRDESVTFDMVVRKFINLNLTF